MQWQEGARVQVQEGGRVEGWKGTRVEGTMVMGSRAGVQNSG